MVVSGTSILVIAVHVPIRAIFMVATIYVPVGAVFMITAVPVTMVIILMTAVDVAMIHRSTR